MSRNYKFNKKLTKKGDTLIQDRLDDYLDIDRQKHLFSTLFASSSS